MDWKPTYQSMYHDGYHDVSNGSNRQYGEPPTGQRWNNLKTKRIMNTTD